MSFTVDGTTWIPQSAQTHALTQLTYLNMLQAALVPPGPQLIASPTNAIWLEFLGAGSIQQEYDDKLYQASQSFNISTCDDNQVLNLAPIVGSPPLPATFSTIYLNVTAAASGDATVDAGALAPFDGINFVVSDTTVVPAGTTEAIFAVADTAGPYLALANQVTAFSSPIVNVQSVTNLLPSTQGSSQETIPAYRARVVAGTGTVQWSLTGATIAIRALQGVTNAQVYFNVDTVIDLELPGAIMVPPRHAYIVIQGEDVAHELANAYMGRMTAPTQGSESEDWITLSGQPIPVYYDIADTQDVYVRLYYDPAQPQAANWLALASDLIVAANSSVIIGQAIDQNFIDGLLQGFTYATITGNEVSLDGISWGRTVEIDANKVPFFSSANISQIAGP